MIPACSITGTNPSDRIAPWINITGAPDPRTSYSTSAPFRCTSFIRWLQSFSQSLCDEKGVGGLLQAPDLAVSDCPEMGESGLRPPPLLRNAEIVPENDHVIARLEVLVPFRVELVEVGQEWEEITDRRVETAIDAPVGESFGNIPLDVIRQERFERIHVSHGVVQLPDESDLRRIRHANLPECLNLNRISCIYAHDYGIRFRLIALRAAALRRCKPRLWRSRSKPRNPLPGGGCD